MPSASTGCGCKAGQRQRGAAGDITRIFDPGTIAGVGKHPRYQIQRRLRARRDQHLRRRHRQATKRPQVVGDGRAQGRFAAGFRIPELPGTGTAPGTVHRCAPLAQWKGFKGDTTESEWQGAGIIDGRRSGNCLRSPRQRRQIVR